MAQPFAYRYPIVDGQGNWGSQDDPKSFAAMRYTEAKLTRYAEVLLEELSDGTVDWAPNYDGTLRGAADPAGAAAEPAAERHHRHRGRHGHRHPAAQPARGGRCLHSPARGARGHDRARCMKHVKGPDLPTGARDHLAARRSEGVLRKGRRQLQGARHLGDRGAATSSSPPSPTRYPPTGCRSRSREQMRAKKLPMVDDLRDESDHENPTRLVIVPRSNRVDLDRGDERTCSRPPIWSATIAST